MKQLYWTMEFGLVFFCKKTKTLTIVMYIRLQRPTIQI